MLPQDPLHRYAQLRSALTLSPTGALVAEDDVRMLGVTERVAIPNDGSASRGQTEHNNRHSVAGLVTVGMTRTLPFRHHAGSLTHHA